MKNSLVWVLIAANVSLAGTLAWRGIGDNTAHAQQPARTPEPGKYVLIPGHSQIGVSIVYVFDSANRRIGAIAPDGRDMMNALPTIDVVKVFEAASMGGVTPPANDNRGPRPRNNTR